MDKWVKVSSQEELDNVLDKLGKPKYILKIDNPIYVLIEGDYVGKWDFRKDIFEGDILEYKEFMKENNTMKEDNTMEEKIEKVATSMASLVKYKNKKYGNAVLEPLNIFSGKCKAGTRLDDKLSRIKNSSELRKNDVSDAIGYLYQVCIENEWLNFDEFKD